MAVKETVPLLEQKPALRATLLEHLLPRARDAKDKVREAYVTAVSHLLGRRGPTSARCATAALTVPPTSARPHPAGISPECHTAVL